jgi:hypothetical protein
MGKGGEATGKLPEREGVTRRMEESVSSAWTGSEGEAGELDRYQLKAGSVKLNTRHSTLESFRTSFDPGEAARTRSTARCAGN